MQRHRSAGPGTPGSLSFRVQRALLLELVTDPPTGGDRLAELARRLDESRADIAGAAGILVMLGLATHDGELLRPTPAARLFDALGLVRA